MFSFSLASTATDPMAMAHYRAGFNHSAMEISRFLIDTPDIEVKVRTRLLTYLSNTCHAVLNNQAPTKQYYPSAYPTSIHQTPEISTAIPKDTPLSTPVLKDPPIPTVTHRDHLPYYYNPSHILMPTPLITGKIAALLAPSPNLYTSLTQPKLLSSQQIKLEPGSSTSTITHGQELPGNIPDSSNDSVITSRDLNGASHTSPQASTQDDNSVWRPWS